MVCRFLVEEFTLNARQYADAFYICTVISALGCSLVSTLLPERGEFTSNDVATTQDPQDMVVLKAAISEVDRYRSMDRLIPTFHNAVTVAVIEVFPHHRLPQTQLTFW